MRCGVLPTVQFVAHTFAELDGIYSANIEGDTDSTRDSSSGGFARDPETALCSAMGEALERYAAAVYTLPLRRAHELRGAELLTPDAFSLFRPEQRRAKGFAWPEVPPERVVYAPAYGLTDNREVWAPHELVGLGHRVEPCAFPSTSTGLAAHPDRWVALLHALDEALERDALATTWINGLGGREVALPSHYADPVRARGGALTAFDLTQRWNPHPVVAVVGTLPLRGRPRNALGTACRATFEEALEKAWLEWLQGVVFAGYYASRHPQLRFASGADVREFPQHGAYYTLHPERWANVPLLREKRRVVPTWTSRPTPPVAPRERLVSLSQTLASEGVRCFYRDLTTPDAAELGMHVARVLSPDLSLLHADERAPFLGGRTRDVAWRYPDLAAGAPTAPNEHPHPLG